MRAILKYPGAKWSLADQIISRFPEHHSYLEPFFGSGAVLFNKPRSHIETVNDLDGDVVNLFRCIREDPERLAREVHFTPYSREAFDSACSQDMAEDPYARAARFLIRSNQGFGFRSNGTRTG
nr:DNA adenine methylase [uncultured Oscillibacter sp.]